MDGYSSDGSTSFFTSEMPDESQLLSQTDIKIIDSWFSEGTNDIDWLAVNGGPMEPLFDYLNQVETSEASCQTKTGAGSGRHKLTATQRRENKRKSDFKYRQNLKVNNFFFFFCLPLKLVLIGYIWVCRNWSCLMFIFCGAENSR